LKSKLAQQGPRQRSQLPRDRFGKRESHQQRVEGARQSNSPSFAAAAGE
jgi:hypothetical protein